LSLNYFRLKNFVFHDRIFPFLSPLASLKEKLYHLKSHLLKKFIYHLFHLCRKYEAVSKIFLDKKKGEYILSCQNLAGTFWKSRLRPGCFYIEVREDILFFIINKFS